MTGPRALASLLLCTAACSPFSEELPEFRDGIESYNQSKWAEAAAKFDEAQRAEPSTEGHIDKGNAEYQQNKFEDAIEELKRATGTSDPALKGRAYLDLGNAHAKAGKLDEAIDDYRRALELEPDSHDARYNLEWALLAKKKQEEQQKDDKKGDKKDDKKKDDKKDEKKDDQGDKKDDQKDAGKKDDQERKDGDKPEDQKQDEKSKPDEKDGDKPKPGEDQKEPQDQQGKEGENKDGEKKEGQQGEQADAKEGEQGKDDKQAPKPMTKQEAAHVLDALQAGEQNFQLWKFQQKEEPRKPVDKDW